MIHNSRMRNEHSILSFNIFQINIDIVEIVMCFFFNVWLNADAIGDRR